MVGMAFGILGIVTGMVWARFTWYVGTNKWWNNDPRVLEIIEQDGVLGLGHEVDEEVFGGE